LLANLDIKTYDVGNFFAATTDGTAVNWGKLWVEYDCELKVPQLNPSGNALAIGGAITGNGSISAANPLGVSPIISGGSNGLATSTNSGIFLAFPGTYLVSVQLIGTVLSASTSLSGTGLTVTSLDVLDNATNTAEITIFQVVNIKSNALMVLASLLPL